MEPLGRLTIAFDRLAAAPPPIPSWPRGIRLSVDYTVRVTANDIETDRDADAHAHACYTGLI